MKRMFMFTIMLLLCSSFVLAIPVTDSKGKNIDNNLKYIEGAEIQIKSTIKAQELVRSMEKFQEKHQSKLYDCNENCKIQIETSTGQRNTAMLRIERKMKFWWMNVEGVVDYEIDSDGEIISQDRNFWQWLYGITFTSVESE